MFTAEKGLVMIPIFIASVSPFSGKNVICLGLGLKFKRDGYRVGYFKPVGFSPVYVGGVLTDEDAVFLSGALEVDMPLQSICPVVLTDDTFRRLMSGEELHVRQKTLAAFNLASQGNDIMITRGMGRLSSGTCLRFSELDFIKESGAKVIFADKFQSHIDMLDGFLYASKMLGEQLLGVVFNLVPPCTIELRTGGFSAVSQTQWYYCPGDYPERSHPERRTDKGNCQRPERKDPLLRREGR